MRTLPVLLNIVAISAPAYANGGSTSTMLNNGVMMPVLGFGTASGVREQHVSLALKYGARLVDTAQAKEWYVYSMRAQPQLPRMYSVFS